MKQTINLRVIELVKKFEGLRLRAYTCPAGKLTIGYGHTGPEVCSGQQISIEQAEQLLSHDLSEAGAAVSELVKVPLTENQFSALVSFVFNCGTPAFAASTLLLSLNAGCYAAVPVQLKRWIHSRGTVIKGLVARRAAEAALWAEPDERAR